MQIKLETPQEFRLRAARQVAGWWDCQLSYRETEKGHAQGPGIPQWHWTCSTDGQSLCCLYNDGTPVKTESQFMTDRLVAHIMQCHLPMVEAQEDALREQDRKELIR